MSSSISSTTSSAATSAASTASSVSNGSAAITSTGIGSGLNVSAIVSELTTAFGEGPQSAITSGENAADAQVSAFGTFQSALDTLQGTLSAIDTPSTLASFKATVADPTVASASTSTGAAAGTYSLSVQNLATAATLTSAPVASASSVVGTGSLTIGVGSSSAVINITSSDNTLAGIAAAINGASNNPGVSASIVTATDGAQLVLTGTATGASNAISVTETDGGTGLSSLTYSAGSSTNGLTQTTQANDANFEINGLPATSASNVVSGAISGVTLNLAGVSAAGTTTTLTVAPDPTTAQTSINSFVTALNGVLSSIQTLTGYNASTNVAGALQGNATLEAFQNQLNNILDTVNASNPGGINSLASIGLTADANTGALDVNSTTLGNELSGSLSSVASLLGGKNGIATQINSLVTQYTQVGGVLDSINSGLETTLSNFTQQQTQLNAELSTYSATLTTQYNAMDTAVASLKETETYLTAQFAASAGTSSSSSSSSSLSSGNTST
jgi:flagellar hook-associated protein 2